MQESKINTGRRIRRHIEEILQDYNGEFPCVLLAGARQTGKTTLLKQICKDKDIPHLTFDDPEEESSFKNDAWGFMNLHTLPLSRREIISDDFRKPFVPSDDYISNRMKNPPDTNAPTLQKWKAICDGGYPEIIANGAKHVFL